MVPAGTEGRPTGGQSREQVVPGPVAEEETPLGRRSTSRRRRRKERRRREGRDAPDKRDERPKGKRQRKEEQEVVSAVWPKPCVSRATAERVIKSSGLDQADGRQSEEKLMNEKVVTMVTALRDHIRSPEVWTKVEEHLVRALVTTANSDMDKPVQEMVEVWQGLKCKQLHPRTTDL